VCGGMPTGTERLVHQRGNARLQSETRSIGADEGPRAPPLLTP
jgi:hypothetical protein